MVDNVWQTLGIEPVGDIRAIKKAYAAKLKKCRPEDDAQGFAQLNLCYKQALVLARQTVDTSIPIKTIENPPVETVTSVLKAAEEPNTPDKEEIDATEYELEGGELLSRVDSLIAERGRRNSIKAWSFLYESRFILDMQFRWQLGSQVFFIISQHNKSCVGKRGKYKKVSNSVLNYLDQLFNWQAQEYDLRSIIEAKNCDQMFSMISGANANLIAKKSALNALRGGKSIMQAPEAMMPTKYNEQRHLSGGLKRLLGLLIDMLIVGGFFAFVYWLVIHQYQLVFSNGITLFLQSLMAAIFFIYVWYFDCSENQGTYGKVLLNMQVTNNNFERIGPLQGFVRTLSFGLLGVGGYLTLLINAYLGRNCMHDRISRSYVIDKSTSQFY